MEKRRQHILVQAVTNLNTHSFLPSSCVDWGHVNEVTFEVSVSWHVKQQQWYPLHGVTAGLMASAQLVLSVTLNTETWQLWPFQILLSCIILLKAEDSSRMSRKDKLQSATSSDVDRAMCTQEKQVLIKFTTFLGYQMWDFFFPILSVANMPLGTSILYFLLKV